MYSPELWLSLVTSGIGMTEGSKVADADSSRLGVTNPLGQLFSLNLAIWNTFSGLQTRLCRSKIRSKWIKDIRVSEVAQKADFAVV